MARRGALVNDRLVREAKDLLPEGRRRFAIAITLHLGHDVGVGACGKLLSYLRETSGTRSSYDSTRAARAATRRDRNKAANEGRSEEGKGSRQEGQEVVEVEGGLYILVVLPHRVLSLPNQVDLLVEEEESIVVGNLLVVLQLARTAEGIEKEAWYDLDYLP